MTFRACERWFILLVSLAMGTADMAHGEGKVALVIGNAAYQNVKKLVNPENDATDLGGKLTAMGFDVKVVRNLTKVQMERELQDFGNKSRRSEMATVFFAGHGIEVGGQNYLLPVDARLAVDDDIDYEAIPLTLVQTAVKGAKQLRLIILDACRDNPFTVAMQSNGGRSVGRGLVRVESSRGMLVAYAAKEGTIADDGNGRNSPYTSALLNHIATPGVDVELMFRRVRDDVMKNTGNKQEPHKYGSLPGKEVYLVPPPAQGTNEKPSPQGMDRESIFWQSAHGDPEICQEYRRQWPQGIYAVPAKRCVEKGKMVVAGGEPSADERKRLETERNAIEAERKKLEEEKRTKEKLERTREEAEQKAKVEAEQTSSTFRDMKTDMEFVRLKGDCFQMGMSEREKASLKDHEKYDAWFKDAEKRHRVCVQDFWLGRYEVTVKQFRVFVTATGYKTDAEKDADGKTGCFSLEEKDGKRNWEYTAGRNWQNPGYEQQDAFPVVCVSWRDAQAYAKWMSDQGKQGQFRLPTEAEWEFSARGGTETQRFWGDDPKDACQYANVTDETTDKGFGWSVKYECSDGYYFSAPVGHFKANPFGLYDMLGNVWEWTCSAYANPYDGSEKKCAKTDDSGSIRVLRGGSWNSLPAHVRSAFRLNLDPGYRNNILGFRLARTYP